MRRILELISLIVFILPVSALADEAPPNCRAPNITAPQYNAGTGDEVSYPKVSWKLSQEGQTTLREVVDETDKPTQVSVVATSYYEALDAAAIEKAYAQRFAPATMNGTPVACYRELVVVWKLAFDASTMSTTQLMPPALYPPRAKERKEEGKTILRVVISYDGHTDDVSVSGSSGFADLDYAGVAYMRHAQLTPAQWNGHPVRTVIYAALQWSLPEGPAP